MIESTPIIDFHAHAGNWTNRAFPDDPEVYIKQMDITGVDRTCMNCIWFGDANWANNLVHNRFVSAYPDRFIGVAFVTPHYPEECIYELDRSFDELNFKVLKLYPDYYGQSSDADGYKPIFEWANQKEIPIMCHGRYGTDAPGTTQLKRYEKFTKDYPKIKWVIAHAGGGTELDSVKTAKELPNIWLETCGSGNPLYAVSYAVNHGLSDRLLFGSDMPIMDYRNQIAKVITADISNDDKKKILGLNAIKLLNL